MFRWPLYEPEAKCDPSGLHLDVHASPGGAEMLCNSFPSFSKSHTRTFESMDVDTATNVEGHTLSEGIKYDNSSQNLTYMIHSYWYPRI